MEIPNKHLKEIVDMSNSDISDLILDDTKFGDFVNNLNEAKHSNTAKLNSFKKKDLFKSQLSQKKVILKEIVEEDSSLEENSESEDISTIQIKKCKTAKTKINNKLLLSLDENDNGAKTQTTKQNFLLNLNLDNYEFCKEKTIEVIDKIYEFIDSEENNIQTYLLDKKIIEEKNIKVEENDYNIIEEEGSIEDFSYEEDDKEKKEENQSNEKILSNENKNMNERNKNILNNIIEEKNKRDNLEDITKTKIIQDNIKNIIIDNDINNYDDTKLFIVEKTENFSFLKDKDKLELKNYLNNKQNDDNTDNNFEIENNMDKILYKIVEFNNKNILFNELINIRITCLIIDENYIYLGDGGGNLLIYSLKEEKLLKQFMNPFPIENKKKLDIKSIYSEENYIITGYEKGKVAVYSKHEKNVSKIKLFESFQDITNGDIIDLKFYTKKNNNVIIIYFSDTKKTVYRIKIKKNKVFKNKIKGKSIIGPSNPDNNIQSFYYLEINPFIHKIIGVVNNDSVSIYIINRFVGNSIFQYKNDNSILSFCFSLREEDKNKFYLSNVDKINIYELNKDYDGAAQLYTIPLQENIIKIGYFEIDLFYVYTQKNNIKLINFNDNVNENDKRYGFIDTISIDNNDILESNNDIYNFLIDFKNHISIKDGNIILYHKNQIFLFKSLYFYEGLNKLNEKIITTGNYEIMDILFKIIIEIYNNTHPLWKNKEPNKLNEFFINYSQSYISLLVMKLENYKTKNEFEQVKHKFDELVKFLFEIEFYDFMTDEKNGLFSILLERKLNDFYFFLLEPYIIDDKFLNNTKISNTFILNLINSNLNKDNKYINISKSWLSEMLLHFPINIIKRAKLDIIQNYLINILLYIIMNYKNYLSDDDVFDYCTPMNLIMQLLKENLPSIDIYNNDLFIKENRYKDEIVFSSDYLRVKMIWYIVYILKNEILKDKAKEKHFKLKSSFVNQLLKILSEEDSLYMIAFNEFKNQKQNDRSSILVKEIIYVCQIILDNIEALKKFSVINKEAFYQKIKELLGKRKEFEICFKIFTIKNYLKENIIDFNNEENLALVLFFMENNCQNSDIYPEIKENQFEDNLIEILKLTDSVTFEDSEKLLKLLEKCQDNYKKLADYILLNYKK